MKPRLKYAEVFSAIDFEHMAQGTALELDCARVTFEGWHYGSIWVGHKRKVHFLKAGDPMISRLRFADGRSG